MPLMNADIFFYRETAHRSWAEQVARGAESLRVQVPEGATLAEILEEGRKAGTAKGSQRSGVFEVQTDKGIFQHHNPVFRERGYGRLDAAKAHFVTWEALDAAA